MIILLELTQYLFRYMLRRQGPDSYPIQRFSLLAFDMQADISKSLSLQFTQM